MWALVLFISFSFYLPFKKIYLPVFLELNFYSLQKGVEKVLQISWPDEIYVVILYIEEGD